MSFTYGSGGVSGVDTTDQFCLVSDATVCTATDFRFLGMTENTLPAVQFDAMCGMAPDLNNPAKF